MDSLFLEITSPHKALMGEQSTIVFDRNGGSIGRSATNDWILPDPDRFLSSKHAAISYENDEFIITDLSSNGVYLNGADEPLGKGNSTPLSPIHDIGLGEFTIKVTLSSTRDSATPAPDTDAGADILMAASDNEIHLNDAEMYDPLDLLGSESNNFDAFNEIEPPSDLFSDDQQMEEYSASSNINDAFTPPKTHTEQPVIESGIPQNWDQTSFTLSINASQFSEDITKAEPNDNASPSTAKAENKHHLADKTDPLPEKTLISPFAELDSISPPASEQKNEVTPKHTPPKSSAPYSAKTPSPSQMSLAAASFKKNGLDPALLDDPYLVDQSLALLPYMLNGLLATLQSRAEVKNELRASKTILQPIENNPLKFSVNVQDAVHNLFLSQRPGFLNPTDSVKQAFEDLTQHEAALITGIQAGLNSLLRRLGPDAIESQIDSLSTKPNFFRKTSAAKKWGYYKETYQMIMENSNDSFLDMFGDDFLKGYETHIALHKNSD